MKSYLTNKMPAFLFDPRVLDDCVSDRAPEATLEGEAAAYFTLGKSKKANYVIYQAGIGRDRIPSSLREIPHTEKERLRSICLGYQKANLLFLPVSVSEPSREYLKSHGNELLQRCEALYVRGEFLKGDAETFKKYGVKIL